MEDIIVETLARSKEEKGYALEKEDAKRILEDLKNMLQQSGKAGFWKNFLMTEDGVASLLWDINNVFYLCEDAELTTPKWYEDKYKDTIRSA